ncbi:unnamed protein product [Periconia digitata]|uniref:UbiA prenyltransferase n=1 Tax=Periconia digitata TaxID=1303443 RepID=A0A9W4UT25_9PLEO|nr:unnamed protein product [Periconia digitata]
MLRNIAFHGYTLWLFTYSDLKTMVFPSTFFATSIYLAKEISQPDHDIPRITGRLLSRIPQTLLWTWINCLAFNVNNQRLPHAIEEDSLNKLWRPMPSKRLTINQANLLAAVVYPIAVLSSLTLTRGLISSIFLVLFGYLYNDLRFGDHSIISRNILNACGFTSFAAGALDTMAGTFFHSNMIAWLAVIGLVILTTVHIQDMYDQIGDAAAGRLTVPLVFGDIIARITIVLPVLVWSLVCPRYWDVKFIGYGTVGVLGVVVVMRLLLVRTVKGDRNTFIIYNFWLASIYSLPLIAFM